MTQRLRVAAAVGLFAAIAGGGFFGMTGGATHGQPGTTATAPPGHPVSLRDTTIPAPSLVITKQPEPPPVSKVELLRNAQVEVTAQQDKVKILTQAVAAEVAIATAAPPKPTEEELVADPALAWDGLLRSQVLVTYRVATLRDNVSTTPWLPIEKYPEPELHWATGFFVANDNNAVTLGSNLRVQGEKQVTANFIVIPAETVVDVEKIK